VDDEIHTILVYTGATFAGVKGEEAEATLSESQHGSTLVLTRGRDSEGARK
jgi:hypothetical protein